MIISNNQKNQSKIQCKKLQTKLLFIFMIFQYHKLFIHQIEYGISGEVCTSLYIESFNKITTKIHVLWKCNQTTNQICNIQHQNL
jgi:hypothetical protein